MRKNTGIFIYLAVLLGLAACQGADSTGMVSRAGVAFGASSAICQPLADKVAAEQAHIASCTSNADCVLTSRVPTTGYSCLELGVNRNSDQTALWNALHDFVNAGCNAHQACLMMMQSTDQPCIDGLCVNSDVYTN